MSQNRRNKPSSGLASCAGCEGCDDDVGDGDTLQPVARGVTRTETDSNLGSLEPLGGPPAVASTYPQGKGADSWLASDAARMVGEYQSPERLKSNAYDAATSPARRPSSPSKTELAQTAGGKLKAAGTAPNLFGKFGGRTFDRGEDGREFESVAALEAAEALEVLQQSETPGTAEQRTLARMEEKQREMKAGRASAGGCCGSRARREAVRDH
jgi:hypothetical protein